MSTCANTDAHSHSDSNCNSDTHSNTVYQSGFSRKAKPIGCVYTEKIIYFKVLALRIMETRESRIYRVGQQVRVPGGDCSSSSKVICWWNSLLLSGRLGFIPVRPSPDLRGPTAL